MPPEDTISAHDPLLVYEQIIVLGEKFSVQKKLPCVINSTRVLHSKGMHAALSWQDGVCTTILSFLLGGSSVVPLFNSWFQGTQQSLMIHGLHTHSGCENLHRFPSQKWKETSFWLVCHQQCEFYSLRLPTVRIWSVICQPLAANIAMTGILSW